MRRKLPFAGRPTAGARHRCGQRQGPRGCELAQLFARAGVRVTLAFRSRLLPEAEPEIGAALERVFRDEGIAVRGGLDYVAIRPTGRGVALDAVEAGASIKGGNENSQNNRDLASKVAREDESEELGLVADFADRDSDG